MESDSEIMKMHKENILEGQVLTTGTAHSLLTETRKGQVVLCTYTIHSYVYLGC